MSIKNPLPGHQYGTAEPGHWYPRPDPPRRPQRKKPHREVALVAVLVVAVVALVLVGRHKHISVTMTFKPLYVHVTEMSVPSNANLASGSPAAPILPKPSAAVVALCEQQFKSARVNPDEEAF